MRLETRRRVAAAGGTAGLALFAGFLAGWALSGGLRQAAAFPEPAGHEHLPGVRLSPAGGRVATGLKCPCGCPNLLLACDCQNPRGAAEVKGFIMELLGNGRSETEARVELSNRYGAAIQQAAR